MSVFVSVAVSCAVHASVGIIMYAWAWLRASVLSFLHTHRTRGVSSIQVTIGQPDDTGQGDTSVSITAYDVQVNASM